MQLAPMETVAGEIRFFSFVTPETKIEAPSDKYLRPARPKAWARGIVAGFLLLAAVILAVAKASEGRKFAELVQRAEPAWLLLAVAYQSATYFFAGGVWHLVLARLGVRIYMRTLAALGLAKLSIDKIIPAAGIGGGVLLVRGLEKRGAPAPVATAALLMELLSTYAARGMSIGIALLVLWVNYGFEPALVALAAAFVVVTLVISFGILWLTRPDVSDLPAWAKRIPGFRSLLRYIMDAQPEVLRNRMLFAKAVLLQLAVILLDAATLDAMLRAIGQPTRLDFVFAGFAISAAVSTISLIPGGLGAFEAMSVLMLRLLGVPIEAGLAATLMLRAYTLWLPMIPGFFILRSETVDVIAGQNHVREGPDSATGPPA
jgi:uncharacterized protein (TIRG00374 family)